VEFQRKRFSFGLKHLIQTEFGFVVKYLTKVRCTYGVHFVQNIANGCVAFATSATPSSTALLALLSNVMHCHLQWELANDH